MYASSFIAGGRRRVTPDKRCAAFPRPAGQGNRRGSASRTHRYMQGTACSKFKRFDAGLPDVYKRQALFITNSDGLPENDLDLLALLVTRGVDGIFLVVADELADDSVLVDELSHLPVPYVMIDRVVDNLSCDKVLFDHEQGGYMATKYLLEKGDVYKRQRLHGS